MHPCEDRDRGTCSDGFGIVFYRGSDGFGHWLCYGHREDRRDGRKVTR
jgi:hypothetical protein